jgi:hypothetical protein
MSGNGNFGKWITDEYGLPAYNYTCNQLTERIAKTKTTYGYSTDHFHQLGNDRIMATAHNGGYVQIWDGSRGFKWLTYRDDRYGKLGGGIGLYCLENEKTVFSDLCTLENVFKVNKLERVFGIGYFKKTSILNDIKIQHNICTPFSDDPVIISEFIISSGNNNLGNNKIQLADFWDVNVLPILKSLIVTWKNRKKFGSSKLLNLAGRLITIIMKLLRKDTENSRKRFAKKFSFIVDFNSELNTIIISPKYRKNPPKSRTEKSSYDYYPKSLFFTIINDIEGRFFIDKRNLLKEGKLSIHWDSELKFNNIKQKNLCLGAGISFNLESLEEHKFITLIGYEESNKIEELVKKYKKILEDKSILEWNASNWKKSLISLKIQDYPELFREIIWHSYYTRSTLFFDEYYKNHRLYQGSVYLFGHGIDGSVRDYVFYLNSLILIDSKIAREFLIFILSLINKDGALPYALYGYGKTSTAYVHSKPSDIYLFLLWGIEQYVSLTRDYKLLVESVPFYNESDLRSTVAEKVELLITYLFSEKVGFGEHGLIKSNDGDWSDGISLMVKNRKKFKKHGESTFNSSFALYIIPRVLKLVKFSNDQLVNLCSEKLETLKQAMLKSFNSKWFYRGWDGQGDPIGDSNLYLEHHTWLLISKVIEEKVACKIATQIYEILDKPSPIGQYISYPPQKTYLNILPKGWDVNGGIWHAMNALLTWGYSQYDDVKAFNSLIKNSLYNRANNYPDMWYGIWSAPDSYIADYADNAGEAFYHLATPMCDFPIMNLNAHATYLLSVIKIAGIDADSSGLILDPHVISKEFAFKSPLVELESYLDKFIFRYNNNAQNSYHVKIKQPIWWDQQSKILVNEQAYDERNIEENFIDIIIPANYGSIEIKLVKKL